VALALKLLSPLYTAVIESLPTASKVVVQVAVSGKPWLSAWVPQPEIVVPLDLKLTVPVAVPEPGEFTVTVAVKVTDAPKADGFDPLVSATVVVVLALLTLRLAVTLLLA